MPGKYKTITATGLLASQSSWDLGYGIADFGDATLAATTGAATALALTIPDTLGVQPFVGSGENFPGLPFPGPLTVATTSRAIGAGSAPIAVATRAWLLSLNSAGTGVNNIAATTTFTVTVTSTATGQATAVTNTLVASTAVNGLTNPLTLLTFAAAPTDRVATLTGTVLTSNPWLLFAGDMISVNLANTAAGAVQIGPNKLAVILEYA
jgi:hypothetical protein